MEENEWVDMTTEQVSLFNTQYGSPNCSDNVNCGDLVVQQQYQLIQKDCGMATIKRRYRAIDWDGAGLVSNWAEQNVNVESKADWAITLPVDWNGACGETIPSTDVIIENGACDLLAYDVEEKVFTTIEEACLKVVRTISIINWCKYEAGGETVTITRTENEHGVVTAPVVITSVGNENVGRIEYVQILKLKDDTAPVITVGAVDTCIDGPGCSATKQFTVSAKDCNEAATQHLVYNWTISANGQLLANGEGTAFEYTVSPKITYDVKWTVHDNCSNAAWEEVSYEFWDCKKPAPYCLHGIAVELMDAGTIQIWATDLERNSSDNCTTQDRLKFRIWHASLGTAPTTLSEVMALPEVVDLNCAYLGNQTVQLYIIDEEGNWDFCETYVIVQDNMSACEGNEGMASVTGTIRDWKQKTVERVLVEANNNAIDTEYMTQENGHYGFELAMNQNYTILPEKNHQPLNGVSTFDLVLISKHILGLTTFDNPYQMIAADVNSSGTITAFDMVKIRQLILNINTAFANSPSWKFVAADYGFTTNNPVSENYPQVIEINDLHSDMEMDFVAIKMGDVNGNARTNSLMAAENRTTAKTFEIHTEDIALEAGATYNLVFATSQIGEIQGYQFTLAYNNLRLEKLQSGLAGVDNFGLHKMSEGFITTSWNKSADFTKTNKQQKETELFTLKFTAQNDGKLSEQLSLANRPTVIEAYDENGELMDIQLTFKTSLYQDNFELYQNTPNPFREKTSIGFYLPSDSEIQLILRDETGRIIHNLKDSRPKGYNTIDLDEKHLTNGFIYYQLTTKFGTKAKKMLNLK